MKLNNYYSQFFLLDIDRTVNSSNRIFYQSVILLAFDQNLRYILDKFHCSVYNSIAFSMVFDSRMKIGILESIRQ